MNQPILDPRIERKLGRKIYAIIEEMGKTPHDNVHRFVILKRRLARAVADYKKYTRRDTLDPNVNYGYHG